MGSRRQLTNTNIIYSSHNARAAQFHQYLQCFRVYILWASGKYLLILAGEIVCSSLISNCLEVFYMCSQKHRGLT